MLPILLGLTMAMFFGLISYLVYGLEGLTHYAWIDTVFWSLIVTGITVSLMNELGQCLACRIQRWFNTTRFESICNKTACNKLLS
ncbi:MAG: hypothetical protein P8101_03665 [Candidatus Thiodiazotropha sp.]|jgi:hypothetical protein